MTALSLRVTHLYPRLMNIYGDRGNIMCVRRRCEARGISFELTELGPDDVSEMIVLVNETQPGPFAERTIAMGRYVGRRPSWKKAVVRLGPDSKIELFES